MYNIRTYKSAKFTKCFQLVAYLVCSDHTYICDWICKNMHSSHIHFFKFKDPQNLLGMIDKLKTFRGYRTTFPLLFLQILDLCIVPSGFYESLNEKN